VASGESATDAHLSACPQCRSRYAAFTTWLAELGDEARAEADEAFPADRLAAQQAQVMRRLEALERPARVIAFPKFARPVTSTQGHAQRWVAAAAAAGLVIGLAAGQFVDIRDVLTGGRRSVIQTQSARAVPQPAPQEPAITPASVTTVSDDEVLFLGDSRPSMRISALQPMDDITPRARDVR
jgi:anti-sigma factor RsiW